ncbi:probable disease resistance RPP8-like protein 4 isoform X2 [Henckelia pumila]|uniref:probable disease resistance RPP8-like protein 4 isoform X2 n=1 Tax=Henckelia pumila TaxID=405737 RepID=UPI003C6E4470
MSEFERIIMEDGLADLSAYDAVASLLQLLDAMLFCYHHESEMLYTPFHERDIQSLYYQVERLESWLWVADSDNITLPSSLGIRIAHTACRTRSYIILETYRSIELNMDEQATATTGDQSTSTFLNKFFRIPFDKEPVVMYDVVVGLLHDLELILSSHWLTSEQHFRKGDIQIMYDNLSMMNSLLIDSSGQGYDQKLMSCVENWVRFAVYRGRDYIASWPRSYSPKKSIFGTSWSAIDHRLCELTRIMEYINQELIDLTEKQPTASFPPTFKHILELQGTPSADGATQISCRKLHRIAKNIEFVNNQLKRIRDGRDVIETSTQSLQVTTSTNKFDYDHILEMEKEKLLSNLSVFEAVALLLQVLDVMLFCHDFERFDTDFSKKDIQAIYHPVEWLESWLANLLRGGYDKTLSRSLEIRICNTSWRARIFMFSEVYILNEQLDIFGQATSSTCIADQSTSTFLNSLLRISLEKEHFVLYDVVVSLLHDLELILSSHWHTRDSEQHFRKADIQIMYDNLNMMDCLLIDSSGQGYDKKLMSSVENWIRFVAYRGRHYIDSWPLSFIEKQPTVSFPDSSKLIDRRLHELARGMKYINRELIDFTEKQPTGSFPPTSKHIFELQGTPSADGATQISCRNLHKITKNIDFVNNQLKRIRDGGDVIQPSNQSLQGTISTGQVLSRMPNERVKLVGFEHDLSVMLDRLTGHPPKLQVLAVVGMGGIGKTTFAQSLYDDPLVRYRFHIRAWFTISQQYKVKQVLIGLLRCLTDPTMEIYERNKEELKHMLYKSLKGKKYLIVLDDIWDKQAWNDLKTIFPDDENGSRIMLTTRLINVAKFAISLDTQPLCLPRLSPDESWELLCSKIPLCPPELEPIGKQIACKCQGLPLAIVVIAGLLSKMNTTPEAWKDVAKSVSSLVMDEQKQCQNILALSYNHLPEHLKPCFLYMGTFPEDSKIPAKKLIWLWIGEGFIRPKNLKSLEEVAENYLEDLIGRSLVQVNRRRYDGMFKTCFIHDMLRDLCLRESHKQHFCLVFHKDLKSMTKEDKEKFMRKCRRVCFHSNTPDTTTISLLNDVRSFLWFKTMTSVDLKSYSFINLKRVKVLDIIDGHLEELPRDFVWILANSRYLALSFRESIDRSIFSSTFHNIQILIVEGEWNGQLPKEFWTMSELRHFYLKRSFLSYWPDESRPNIMQLASAAESPQALIYPVQYEEHSIKVMPNLQSLTTIRPISCTKAAFLSMPNLKKLGVYENEEDCGFRGWFKNLVHLQELQTLKYVFHDPFFGQKPERLPSQNFILAELIKLTISGTAFPWDDMLKLCALPKLEVLKLKNYAFLGPTWALKPEAGGFPCLKYLLIGSTNLQSWEVADDTNHFPKLEHLVMMNCRRLKEIPYGIFVAPLLERIELHNCSETTVDAAEQLQQELLDNGNNCLVLHITPDRRQR